VNLPCSHKMKLLVKFISGETITLDVEPKDSILNVKERLKQLKGIDVEF
jgi:UV excision repair protein RAD23